MKLTCFIFFILTVAALTAKGNGQLCEQVRVPYCANLANFHGYTMQANELNQGFFEIVLSRYESLFNCSEEMKYFVCSALLPSCENSRLKYPCNSFCRSILTAETCQNELREIMLLNEPFGNEITNIFNCDVLYGESSERCIRYPNETQTTTNLNANTTQTHTNNSSQFCKRNIHYSTNAKYFASIWLIITTTPITLILLFTFFSILINLSRFEYPTRPILYMVLSHLVYCLGVTLRSMVGYNTASCQQGEIIRGEYWTTEHAPCVIIFITTYFGIMSYLVWTCILTICLMLSKLFQWSDADIAKYRVVFHAVGWTISTTQTLMLVSVRESRADELTGICSVHVDSRFVFLAGITLPVLSYTSFVVIGIALSLCGIARTYKRMGFYQKHLEKGNQIRCILRIAIFLIGFILIFAVFIITTTYDYIAYPSYSTLPCQGVNCRVASPAVGIINVTCILASGLLTTIWIARSSTSSQWRNVITKLTCRREKRKHIQTQLSENNSSNYNIGEITNLEVKVPGFVDVTHSSYDEYIYSIASTTTATSRSGDSKILQPTIVKWDIPNTASICSTAHQSISTV